MNKKDMELIESLVRELFVLIVGCNDISHENKKKAWEKIEQFLVPRENETHKAGNNSPSS